MKTNREYAVEWWKTLCFDSQVERKRIVLGNLISMEDLTDNEVEFIYNFYHQ